MKSCLFYFINLEFIYICFLLIFNSLFPDIDIWKYQEYISFYSLSIFFMILFLFYYKKNNLFSLFKKFKIKKEIFLISPLLSIGTIIFLEYQHPYYNYLNYKRVYLNSLFFAPIMEELFFRGFVFKVLKTKKNTKKIIFISGILFLLSHSPEKIPYLFISGSIFYEAYIYSKSNSIYSSIFSHILGNFFVYLNIYIANNFFLGYPFLLKKIIFYSGCSEHVILLLILLFFIINTFRIFKN